MPSSPAPNQPIARIKNVLPEDRRMAGTLTLRSGNATLMCVQCLGSSHRRFDQLLGYGRSDRLEIDGDASLGSFALIVTLRLRNKYTPFEVCRAERNGGVLASWIAWLECDAVTNAPVAGRTKKGCPEPTQPGFFAFPCFRSTGKQVFGLLLRATVLSFAFYANRPPPPSSPATIAFRI